MKEIAIIGAGGRMGTWFLKYFINSGNFQIKAYDKDLDSIPRELNIRIEQNFNICIKDSDIVILCVPLRIIPKMILDSSRLMKRNSVLIDISSIKNKSFKSLCRIENYILPICIHPMFGPGASLSKGSKIIFIPVNNYKKELGLVKNLFPKFNILPIENASKHDRIMAVVLGLNHYINIIFADILRSHKSLDLLSYSGNTFKIQSILSESILNDDPDLINSLFMQNPYMKKEIEIFYRKVLNYNKIINEKDDKEFKNKLKRIISFVEKHNDLDSAYVKMYKFIELLHESNHLSKYKS